VTFAGRLVLGTFTVVVFTLLVVAWGLERGSLLAAASLALVVALPLAWVIGRSVAKPLVSLSNAAHDLAAGAAPRFPRSGIVEVDTLVRALRDMNYQIADRVTALQQEKAASGAIVAAMGEGIVAADERGQIVIANPAARELLGYDSDDALPDLRTLFRVKAAREAIAEVLDGHTVQDREFELDDQIIAMNARPIPAGGAVVVLRDLTEMRRLESVRRDFVANVSHELKTPLTSISGYAETLVAGGVSNPDIDRFLGIILNNSRRMQRLVDDLLDLSRIESGHWTPRLSNVDIEPLVADAWLGFADRARDREITFTVEPATDARRFIADPDALRHILGNLLDNALRHTGPNGSVTVRTALVNGELRLTVSDTGSGIAAEHLDRIFERFYRVDPSRSREEGGTGLGLAIVRHMVEAHGGECHAESVLRRGTSIHCSFPQSGITVTGL
jgi:signal transduction histidine kinase